jgi:hypothetical protein
MIQSQSNVETKPFSANDKSDEKPIFEIRTEVVISMEDEILMMKKIKIETLRSGSDFDLCVSVLVMKAIMRKLNCE